MKGAKHMKNNFLKKTLVWLLLVTMTITPLFAFTGCFGGGGDSEEDNHIVMTYFYGSKIPRDLDLVEKAVSDYAKEKIGITVEFYPISVYNQDYTRIVGVDEIDLMCVAFSDPLTYAEYELIQPINEDMLNELAPDLMKENASYDMLVRDAGGNVIGVNTREKFYYNSGSYVVRKSSLEACPCTDAGVTDGDGDGKITLADKYVDKSMIDLDDLRVIFAAIKENDCDAGEFPIISKIDESVYAFSIDELGSGNNKATGVLNFGTDNNVDGNTKVVNYYETQEFVDYCKFMAECVKNGWMSSEATTSPQNKVDAFNSGNAKGVWLDATSYLRDSYTIGANETCVQLLMFEPCYVPMRSDGTMWAICGTSEKSEAVIKFMNLFWTDKTISNMVQWGIEGTHYKVVDEENNLIDFADGVTAETSGFYMGGGFYGDKRLIYTYVSGDEGILSREEQIQSERDDIATGEKALESTTEAGNFIYDASKYKNQIKNIEAIIKEYANDLACGGYTDAKYNEFIGKLKNAGIDEIIADKQQQLDSYLDSLK